MLLYPCQIYALHIHCNPYRVPLFCFVIDIQYLLFLVFQLNEINKQLEMLRNMVVQRCRKMTTDEKRKLGAGLCHLTPEDLSKALELVAQDNPDFQTTAEEVDLDMDAQSETTLWRLKFFVREALERQANAAAAPGKTDENAKRKRDIYNALAKTASKRIRR